MLSRTASTATPSLSFSRPAGLAALGVAALLSLSGCTLTPPTDVTDAESRDRFLALVEDAQQVAGGSWTVQDDSTPRECVIPLWVTGQRIPVLRTGSAPRGGLADVAQRLEGHWVDAGLRTTISELGDVVEVKGESSDGELILFRVSATAMTLTGESECRPV